MPDPQPHAADHRTRVGSPMICSGWATAAGRSQGVLMSRFVCFITWGGDMVTFHANGGLKTKQGQHLPRPGSQAEPEGRRRLRPTSARLSQRQVTLPARHLSHDGHGQRSHRPGPAHRRCGGHAIDLVGR